VFVFLRIGRLRLSPPARGNSPENHGSSLLNGLQALAHEIGVSVPELEVMQSIFSSPARLLTIFACLCLSVAAPPS